MKYSIYDTSGKVLWVIDCHPDHIESQVQDGVLRYVEGDYLEHQISNGRACLLPVKPSQFHEWDYEGRCWTVDEAAVAIIIRKKRAELISASDWTQGKDISDDVSKRWVGYRQSLRDITTQKGFPLVITWPEIPA